jgi:hypothetical protein
MPEPDTGDRQQRDESAHRRQPGLVCASLSLLRGAVHNMQILIGYCAQGCVISVRGEFALMASARSGILYV